MRRLLFLCLLPVGLLAQEVTLEHAPEEASPVTTASHPEKGLYTEIAGVSHTYSVKPSAKEADPEKGVFKRVQAAVDRALEDVRKGEGAVIVLDPGDYVEAVRVELPPEARTEAPLVLRAAIPLMSVFRGSDLWPSDNWDFDIDARVYSRAWPYGHEVVQKPLGRLPWPVRDTAMVYINGVRLQQVYWPVGMTPGSFHLHENGRIYFVPPKGIRVVDWESIASIEVSNPARAQLLVAKGVNLVLQGILFQHAPGKAQEEPAVEVSDAARFWAEHCSFNWNNDCGLGVQDVREVFFRRIECKHNGIAGLRLRRIERVEGQGVGVSLNFWRGIEAGARTDFFPELAAWTLYDVDNLKLDYPIVTENRANGFFVQGARGQWQVQGGFIAANNGWGLYFQYMKDLTLRNVQVIYNNGTGLDVAGRSVALENCILLRNGLPEVFRSPLAQIALPGAPGLYRFRNLVVESDLPEIPVVRVNRGEGVFPSFENSGNLYYAPEPTRAFSVYEHLLDMNAWRQATASDMRSLFANPQMAEIKGLDDPYALDFEPSSPIYTRQDWPEVSIEGSTEVLREELRCEP